jgi:hypothetical protein
VDRIRRKIERLGPYQSLALLALPACTVEPAKLLAVALVGEGHWITGTIMVVLAYAASLLVVHRLFVIVKPRLLELRWFARAWGWFVTARTSMLAPALSAHCRLLRGRANDQT